MRLGSGLAVAVVQAGGYSSDSTPSLGTSICCKCGPKKIKKKKKDNFFLCISFLKHMEGEEVPSFRFRKQEQLKMSFG